ncbi:hypothetical protein EV702DRAFT_1050056 [Suillus placidus]|uniref:Uncharacterized protein n=1 Tax=Suillus placidus TaxID=48579 RepID=A0A9P6ZEP6_9AGAM|nr:hypothetical protein EV702DRAFT_1053759 [Suillus placidus]KAG1768248.1 hypothetical protein EV702DRAFT_1050056 [Suillus placidus]
MVNYGSAQNSRDTETKTTTQTPTYAAARLTEGIMAPQKCLHSIWISNLLSKKARVHTEQSSEKEHTQVLFVRSGKYGKEAAWAIKRYRGHRVLPESIMREFEQSH